MSWSKLPSPSRSPRRIFLLDFIPTRDRRQAATGMQQLCGGVALRVPKMRHILIYSIALGISISWFINSGFSVLYAVLFGVCATYLPFYFNGCERKDGFIWPYFQRLSFWRTIVANYHQGTVNVETKLDNTQQYIFCCFPHGACSDLFFFYFSHYQAQSITS